MISTDIIIAAEHSTFALPEINVGVIADAATIKLRRRIPYHVAVEFLMTGRWMDAKEARHWGLINEIVPANILILLDSSASMKRKIITGDGIENPGDIIELSDGNIVIGEGNLGFAKINSDDKSQKWNE